MLTQFQLIPHPDNGYLLVETRTHNLGILNQTEAANYNSLVDFMNQRGDVEIEPHRYGLNLLVTDDISCVSELITPVSLRKNIERINSIFKTKIPIV